MVTKHLEIGDLVWAKMKGFPAWPGKIIEPPIDVKSPKQKKAQHYVYFFGSDNHAWILDENIVPHGDHMIQFANKKKSAAYQSAIEAIISYSKNNVTKSKPSTSPVSEKEKSYPVEKESSTTSSVHLVNNVSKKRDEKIKLKKVQLKTRLKDIRMHKKPLKRRISQTNDINSSNERSSHVYEFSVLNSPDTSAGNGFSYSDLDNESPLYLSRGILSRPRIERPPSRAINEVSEMLLKKHIKPTDKRIGFLGLGHLGKGIVKNLLNSGHHITVWNRSPERCEGFVNAGAFKAQTPADVVSCSDIIFCCVSGPNAVKSLVFGNCGVLSGLENSIASDKGYVEMSSIDPETSQEIAEAVMMKGARYLEAPVNGSKLQAEEGTLFIFGAGDRSLFADCETCFHAMGKHAYFISCEVGNGSKMNLIMNMLRGSVVAALAEAMALVDRLKLSQEDFKSVLKIGTLNCQEVLQKCEAIIRRCFVTNTPLKHMQSDMALALGIGNICGQPLPLVAASNEIYKHARLLRYTEHDVCAVYQGSKF